MGIMRQTKARSTLLKAVLLASALLLLQCFKFCSASSIKSEGAKCLDSAADSGRCSEGESQVLRCKSSGLFKFQDTPPKRRKASKLSMCQNFAKKTCCNKTHTNIALRKTREMALAGFPPACMQISEKVFCMNCHPSVGTGEITTICPKLCNSWYNACANEFFSSQGINVPPAPCYGDAVVCSQLSSFIANGRDMCKVFGYEVALDGTNKKDCYDGHANAATLAGAEAEVEEDDGSLLGEIIQMLTEQPTIPAAVVAVLIVLLLLAFGTHQKLE